MAHADYHCCAVCDCKLDYAGMASRTKEDLCIGCEVGMTELAGRPIESGADVATWIATASEEDLETACISKCYYLNDVDDAVKARGDQFFSDNRNFVKTLATALKPESS